MICGLRLYKRAGGRCRKCETECKSSHRGRGAGLQAVLKDMLGDDAIWFWNSSVEYFERLEPEDDSKCVQAMEHIFLKEELEVRARQIGWTPFAYMSPASYLCNHYIKLAALSKNERFINALTCLQTKYRCEYAKKLHGPNKTPVNATDAFTLEPIADISSKYRFSFESQDDGSVYAFSAPELHRYITAYAAVNPFTRVAIPAEALERLTKLMANVPQSVKQPITVWRSPQDAFVDVLHSYECFGFYTSLEWFSELSCEAIYTIFETLSRDRHIPSHLFNLERLDTEVDPDEILMTWRYALATTMQTIVRYTFETQFYTICKLFVALADTNEEMRTALPQWVNAGAAGQMM